MVGTAMASDKPCATTWVAPKNMVNTGVAITALPTPNNPPRNPETLPKPEVLEAGLQPWMFLLVVNIVLLIADC